MYNILNNEQLNELNIKENDFNTGQLTSLKLYFDNNIPINIIKLIAKPIYSDFIMSLLYEYIIECDMTIKQIKYVLKPEFNDSKRTLILNELF